MRKSEDCRKGTEERMQKIEMERKKQIIHESIRKNENDLAKYSKSQKFVLK